MGTPHLFPSEFDGPPVDVVDHSAAASLREAAEREMNGIAEATAVQIGELVRQAHRDMALLRIQIDVALADIDDDSVVDARNQKSRHVSPSAEQALEGARRALDHLLDDIAGVPDRTADHRDIPVALSRPLYERWRGWHPTALQWRQPRFVAAAAVAVFGVALGVATVDIGGEPHRPALVTPSSVGTTGLPDVSSTASAAAPPASPRSPEATQPPRPQRTAKGDLDGTRVPAAAADLPEAPVDSGPSGDAVRKAAETWLLTYFAAGGSPPAGTAAIIDERPQADRVDVNAKRVVAPPRVNVYDDVAVLSTSVSEYPPAAPGTAVISLVSQLWTRRSGEWQLDEVRIVSADAAGKAFRR